jgi:hypothetical protein
MSKIKMNFVGEVAQPLIDALDAEIASSPFSPMWHETENEQGNCFPMAFFLARMAKACGYAAVVVHGEPTLQREPFCPFVHGWVEIGLPFLGGVLPICLDYSNQRRVISPLGMFYSVGKIDPATCRRYTADEALELLEKHGHFGFYHESNALSL